MLNFVEIFALLLFPKVTADVRKRIDKLNAVVPLTGKTVERQSVDSGGLTL